jgi:hypothetical protein
MTRYDELKKLFGDCEGDWGPSDDWLPEQDERFGHAAARIMARGPVDRVAERRKRLADLGAILRRQATWPGWAWDLWRFSKAEQSRANIRAWLATKRFPCLKGSQLSSAAIEQEFKRDCPGQYYQRCHFDDVRLAE